MLCLQYTAHCTHIYLRDNARVVRWGRVPCSSASQVVEQSTLNSSYLIKRSKFYLPNREQSLLYPADFGLPRVGLNFKRFHHCWTKVEDKKPAPCLTRHCPGVCWWKLATSFKQAGFQSPRESSVCSSLPCQTGQCTKLTKKITNFKKSSKHSLNC